MTDRITSSDGVQVAVHSLTAGARPLLVVHATGFHGWCYRAMARAMGDGWAVTALDVRGHGDTPAPDGVEADWDRYTHDVVNVAQPLVRHHGPLAALGHSMGGACLLQATARHPELFERVVVFEPIVPPPHTFASGDQNPLSAGARRRRPTFPSFAAAIANYAAKRPLATFRGDVLADYVHHGFRPTTDGVTLKCRPEVEAATFDGGGTHSTWDLLPTITTPVHVVAGSDDGSPPPGFAEAVAHRIPAAVFERVQRWDHFAPMVDPDGFAADLDARLR